MEHPTAFQNRRLLLHLATTASRLQTHAGDDQDHRQRSTSAFVWFACIAALLSLLPVWMPGTLPPTCDGPSHAYNAMLARTVEAGQAPFSTTFVLRHFPRSNFASDLALGALGAQFGWVTSERIWLTIVLAAQFAAFFYVFHAFTPAWRIALAAFLAHNWFLWMGFYDFSLSLAVFVAFLAAVLAKPTKSTYALVLAALMGLYATHFFTFFFGLSVAVWVFGWRLAHRQMKWPAVGILIIPAVFLVTEVFGPVVHGGIGWWGWRKVVKSVLGLVVGDCMLTFSWAGLLAGIALMTIVWCGVYWYLKQGRTSRDVRRAWIPVFGLLLFLVSIVAPAQVGVGTHVAARMRILGEILIVVATADHARKMLALQPLRIPAVSLAISAALLIQTGQMVAAGHRVAQAAARLDGLIANAGVKPGDWIVSRLDNVNQPEFRIVPYKHLADRAYCAARVRSVDNYEASIGNFQVQWRNNPGAVVLRRPDRRLMIGKLPQEPDGPATRIWVIREQGRQLLTGPDLKEVGLSVDRGLLISQVVPAD